MAGNAAWLDFSPAMVVFWVVYAGSFLPEIIGGFFQKAGKADKKQDRGTRTLVVIGTAGSFVVAFNLAPNLQSYVLSSRPVAMLWLGTLVIAAGAMFRWYSIRVLGRFFTRDVAIRQGHRIVRDGPYRYLRHPSYAGYLLAVLGVGIALNNAVVLVILIAVNVAVFSVRMNVEEAVLEAAFGDSYRAYKRETKRIVPMIY